jgi:hypothetical protein
MRKKGPTLDERSAHSENMNMLVHGADKKVHTSEDIGLEGPTSRLTPSSLYVAVEP